MRCIPAKQALTIQWAPNLVVLHLCTCRASVMQPLCLYPQSVDFHLFICFQPRMQPPLSFPRYERRLGMRWHNAWTHVYAQMADGESSVHFKEEGAFKDIFPLDWGSAGRREQKGGLLFHEKGWNQHFTLFSQSKTPVCMTGKRQEHCSLQQK